MGVTAIERYKQRGLVTHLRNHDDLRALLKTVELLPVYVGAKPFKNESEEDDIPIVMLANFIMKHFPWFTPATVVEAFEHAAAGKLHEDGKLVTITSWGKQMNLDLLGGVLRVYSQHLRDKTVDLRPLEDRVDKPHLLHSGTQVAMKPGDFLDDLVDKCKKDGAPPRFHMYRMVHQHLIEIGKLKPDPKANRRTGTTGTIRALLQNDIHQTAVIDWLIKEGHLPKPTIDADPI